MKKRILLLIFLSIILLPISINAEVNLDMECEGLDNFAFGDFLECIVKLDSDEQLNDIIFEANANTGWSLELNDDWKIDTSYLENEDSENYGELHLIRVKESDSNIIGVYKPMPNDGTPIVHISIKNSSNEQLARYWKRLSEMPNSNGSSVGTKLFTNYDLLFDNNTYNYNKN